ncbi:MAG: hypothetical protein AAGA58_17245 [Verrucomicrobiota bacterium]
MWVEAVHVPATIHFDGTIDNTWSDPGNWSLNRLPYTGDTAVLTGGDAVVIDDAVSTGAKVFVANTGHVASLTIQNGGSLALGTLPLNVGQGGDGTLTVESGATLTSNGLLRAANNAAASGTINVSGIVDITSGINVNLTTGTAFFNLINGRLRGNNFNGLDATDTNVMFNLQKGWLISKANTQGDLVDDLAALQSNGYITFSNGRDPGWGKSQLGFDSYSDLDYAITNAAGTDTLYIDFDAPGSTWEGDGTVVAMWVERIHTPLTYHVAPSGNDNNDGLSAAAPLKTIGAAANRVLAGDTVRIHAGTYPEQITKSGLAGLPGAPITFKAHGNGPVIIDGTRSVAGIQADSWTLHGNGIYKTTLTQDIWQLFLDGEMMMEGRWPNASLDDGSIWDRDEWAHSSGASTNGNLITDASGSKPDLAATGVSFEGGWVVFNGGQWNTLIFQNFNHTAGTGTITYNNWNNFRGSINEHRYFITAHLDCVDVEGEWYYDNPSNVLYFKAPGGGVPTGDLRGRVRRWGFDLNNTSHVVIQGIEFFGCSIEMTSSPDLVLEDCKFKFYNAQKRVLNSGQWSTPFVSGLRATIRNCEFSYSDGRGFDFNNADHAIIENILMHDIDWTGGGSSTVHMGGSQDVRISRFTMYNTGASEGLHMGSNSITELCRTGPLVGSLQQDGSPIHFNPWAYENSIIRYCWTLNHGKRGARGDVNNSGSDFQGTNFLMHHNVARGCGEGGLSVAGDFQEVYNNSSFANNRPDIYLIEKGSFVHANTITRNNATNFNGIANRANRHAGQPPPGILSNNWDASNVANELVDQSNFDFRPKPGSPLIDGAMHVAGITDGYVGPAPDIGAYEHGDSDYWIPGFQTAQASTAIPPDGATNQPADRDLIWLGGWEGTSYDVYFGTSETAVHAATRTSPEFRGNQSNNIFKPTPLSNTSCYWRIDTVTPSGTEKGEVWQLRYGAVSMTPYQLWEIANGIAGAGRGTDSDSDTFINEHEYFFGLNPGSGSNGRLPILGTHVPTGQMTLTYTYRADDPGVSYLVQQSADLDIWSPASIGDILDSTPNTDGTTTVTLLLTTNSEFGRSVFFRVVATD